MTDPIRQDIEALTLNIGGEVFAIDANMVREILDVIPITEVPGAQPYVHGLINVRGKVVPVADLRLKFGMPVTANTLDTRIVVIEIEFDDGPITVGLLADKVYEVADINAATIEETPTIGMSWRPDFISGIAKSENGFVILPNVIRLFSPE